ncbi:MAG: hypothetical protein AAF456_09030 [Planctomycetota bacterium]
MEEADYSKFDAPLMMACNESHAQESFPVSLISVFIHLISPPDEQQKNELEAAGVVLPKRLSRIITAQLTREALVRLSQYDWVKALKLSQQMKRHPGESP